MSFFCSGGFSFKWENAIFAAYFILRGRDMHIDFLRLLFLVGVICPLMQEHSLRLKNLISQAPEDAMLKIRRPVYKRLFKSNRVLRADQKSDVNQTCQHSVFSPKGACIRIWCTSGAVERRSQMFVYRLSHFPFSLLANFFTLSPNREPLHRLSQTRSTYSNIVHDFLPMLFLVFLLTSRKCRKGRSTNSIAQNHWLLSNKGILKWSKKYESLWANLSLLHSRFLRGVAWRH